jgi:hypothetical protein
MTTLDSKRPDFKCFRPSHPNVHQALNEIAIVSEIQNRISYANSYVVRTGKLSLHYETEDELEREERARKETQQWLQHLEQQQQQEREERV